MKYKYNNVEYVIEYAVITEEDFDIWLQNPEQMDDYVYLEKLPEHIQDELYSMVLHDVLDKEMQDEKSFVGYLD